MTVISSARFVNFWRNLYQKFNKLSLGKQLGIILIAIIVIWQAVCFVQGAITARAMNYYCEKEAGVKLAEGTYFMEIPKDEYEKNCWKKEADSYPFYCDGSYDRKVQWIEVNGSVKRPSGIIFFRVPPKDRGLPNYIADDIGGLRKKTTYSMNAHEKLVYTEIDFIPNAELTFADSLSYYLFKKSALNSKGCGFSRFPSTSRNLDNYKLYVNQG